MADGNEGDGPNYAEENALRNATESLTHYDSAADTFTAVFGAPVPASSVFDEVREVLVRVEPQSRAVVGFTIPNFTEWYAKNYPDGGEFELDLPPVWEP
ncbi:MAG: hypothetical protein EXQ74_05105 [Thermoleophilia bacterium]|nr:hypothetical protein [Thermoleophilia bacterium]